MTGRPKVVQLTTGPPTDTRVRALIAATIADSGYDVVLVAPGDDSTNGRQADGVRVVAVRPPRGRAERLLLTPWRLVRAARRERPDAYHVHDSKFQVAAVLRLTGARVIYDVHEDVTLDLRDRAWIPAWLRTPVARIAGALEQSVARRCDAVICAEPAIVDRFPPARTTLVQNFPRFDEVTSRPLPTVADGPARVVYVGSLTRARGISELVDAIGVVPAPLDARLVLAGSFGDAGLEHEVRRAPTAGRVDVLGYLDRPAVWALLAAARVAVATLHPTPWFRQAQPVKLFEYLAAGLPVVATDLPGWREIARDAACYVDPRDPDAIAEAITWILTHPDEAREMGRRGRRRVETRYRWESEALRLRGLYAEVVGPAPADRIGS